MRIPGGLLLLLMNAQLSHHEVAVANIQSPGLYKTRDDYLRGHNLYRRMIRVGKGTSQPRASNLHNLIWNHTLESKARQMSLRCRFMHEEFGENLHASTSPIFDPLKNWFDEHKKYTFRPISKANLDRYGHYTQMVWADTKSVGCWRSRCGWLTIPQSGLLKNVYYTVCKYFPAGNLLGQLPYRKL
ncbi:hypothetical protein FGIG_05290 [Fasciola gigantica]|uniref:SCP domain-containing protein n=1 Tax=Fasciola gigantica TaxID=46835 RepID=A0A504YPV8_FASGI|nr:hypothetical protein FGIG_05290 [Fasciola gigantica]